MNDQGNQMYKAKVVIDRSVNPIRGFVDYEDSANHPLPAPLTVRNNDKLQFELWEQHIEGDAQGEDVVRTPIPGDLVLASQYDADVNDAAKKPRRPRRSPFKANNMAIYLDHEAPGDWLVNLQLNGATNPSYFEYCILALLDDDKVVVEIDPSIIINP